MRTIYMDGIFDLFHSGHVLCLKKLKELDNTKNFVIVGIINDKDATNYKRNPIYCENTRKILVESCKYVDKVIENAPMIADEKFISDNDIDLVCHGFYDKKDQEKQKLLFEPAIKLNKFRITEYNYGISTTEIIKNIKMS